MINAVLQRLESLQAELASLDPTHEIAVADQIEVMAKALRDVTETSRRHDRVAASDRQACRAAA